MKPACSASRVFFQHRYRCHVGGAQSRQDAENHTAKNRDRKRNEKNSAVHLKVERYRNIGWRNELSQHSRGPGGDKHRQDAAGRRQNHTLDEQLPDQPPSAGANRKAYGNLAPSRNGPHQH